MSEMLLVVTLGGRAAALPADRVHSVVEPTSVVPVPRAPAHVAGLAALRSPPLTIIDCRSTLGLSSVHDAPATRRVVVVEQAGHLYGLSVDSADDMVAATGRLVALSADPGPGWDRAVLGMVETSAGPLLLLDIAVLVAGPEPIAA